MPTVLHTMNTLSSTHDLRQMQNLEDIPTPALLLIVKDLELVYKDLGRQLALYSALQVASLELENKLQIAQVRVKNAVIVFNKVEQKVEVASPDLYNSDGFQQETSRSKFRYGRPDDLEERTLVNEGENQDAAIETIEKDVKHLEPRSPSCGLSEVVRNAVRSLTRVFGKPKVQEPFVRSRAPSPE